MKRIALGIVWFFVIWLGVGAGLGGIVGAVAQQEASARGEAVNNYEQGYSVGREAGRQFGRKYGGLILLGALALAICGTAFGVLPGTRPAKKAAPDQPPELPRQAPARSGPPSPKTVMLYEVSPEGMAKAYEHFAAHRARIDEFHRRGVLLMVGPYADPAEGAMGIFTSRAAAEEFVQGDPFVIHGVVARSTLRDWNEALV
ncbi:MAG: hypothetical protein JWR07_481 [Nevskia sp.]|nr:hypothetical protein [Nevskia sp.]